MKILVQRVLQSSVHINNSKVASIHRGILCLIGFEKHDNTEDCFELMKKVINYRIFPDDQRKMNLSLIDIEGELLIVPQVTLAIETNKGKRPSFSKAADPEKGEELFEELKNFLDESFENYQSGIFGEDMNIEIVNEGPVTFLFQN